MLRIENAQPKNGTGIVVVCPENSDEILHVPPGRFADLDGTKAYRVYFHPGVTEVVAGDQVPGGATEAVTGEIPATLSVPTDITGAWVGVDAVPPEGEMTAGVVTAVRDDGTVVDSSSGDKATDTGGQ